MIKNISLRNQQLIENYNLNLNILDILFYPKFNADFKNLILKKFGIALFEISHFFSALQTKILGPNKI